MISLGNTPNVARLTVPSTWSKYAPRLRCYPYFLGPARGSFLLSLPSRTASVRRMTPVCATLATNGATSEPLSCPLGPNSDTDLCQALVAVMSTPACFYCKRTKEALTSAGISYVDVNVGSDTSLRYLVQRITGKRTVPQIFVAGRSIGGCDDLLSQLADGSFQRVLAEAKVATAAAVPGDLLAAIQTAQLRAREAAEAQAASSCSAAAPLQRRLGELRTRLGLLPAQGGIARSLRSIGSRDFQVFTARQLLDWLATAGETDPRTSAAPLLSSNAITPATRDRAEAERVAAAIEAWTATGTSTGPKKGLEEEAEKLLLTLPTEAPHPAAGEALNTAFWWYGQARPANEVAATLRQLILELYDSHLSADGRSFSYGAVRADPRFPAFVAASAELQKVDLAPLSREELLAFTINLYNALIIHALVALNLTRMSTSQRSIFYSRTAKYNIGGLDYTADDLENGVLRGNRAGASNVFNLLGLERFAGGHWRSGDSRLAKVVSPVDARIHFALVCGAKSCPPIKLYTPDNLEEGLAAAAEAFCADEVQVDRVLKEVKLSKIFKWYAVDFGADKYQRLLCISTFLFEPARSELQQLVHEAKLGSDIRVQYNEYDWSLNGTD